MAIIIPAFNEALTIARVVAAARTLGEVIVVDDGSTDDTAPLADEAGAQVVRHQGNRGYDAALASGLDAALRSNARWAMTIDADGQHDPACLKRMSALLQGGAELVLGRRGSAARWSEALFNAWVRLRFGPPDILCGLKGYSAGLIRQAGPDVMARSIGTGLALWALRRGIRPALVDVPIRPRTGVSRLGSAMRANWLIFKALLAAMRQNASGPAPLGKR